MPNINIHHLPPICSELAVGGSLSAHGEGGRGVADGALPCVFALIGLGVVEKLEGHSAAVLGL